MESTRAGGPGTISQESNWVIVGLCAITASLIIIEVCLTKFVSYKVHYHFVYAIISTVTLASGFAGIWVHLKAGIFGKASGDPWRALANSAVLYAVSLLFVTVLFCWLPFHPYLLDIPEWAAHLRQSTAGKLIVLLWLTWPLALYFLLFSIPFFFAGLAVSGTLVLSKRPVPMIYFYDLLAAAVGAAVCPIALESLGGYGTVLAAGVLGMCGYLAYARVSPGKRTAKTAWVVFALGVATLLVYPGWALKKYGFDIRSARNRDWHDLILNEFKGFSRTYWNAVARIDITKTACSPYFEEKVPLCGRYVFVDGAAPTRQIRADGQLLDKEYLRGFLWGSPYILKPDIERTLIIGGGGGVDILVGKFFRTPIIDVVELNPATYEHVLMGRGDAESRLYQPWLHSTPESRVYIYNSEGRHLCTTLRSQSYDLIQTTMVDTLTAITSGALSMVENYLYTRDAVQEYIRLLKPGGLLSLSHWRTDPPATGLRMFLTYLDYLESQGIREPWRHVIIVATHRWTDEIMRLTPFTPQEVEKIRNWARAHGHVVLFDPFAKDQPPTGVWPSESIYFRAGYVGAAQRRKVLDQYELDVNPVSDDRPFFYKFAKTENPLISSKYSATPLSFVLFILVGSIVLALLPLVKIERKELSKRMLSFAACFALAGFAFLLFETAIIQLFSIFVGGPIYSLAVVLVAVLAGYACGSLLARRLAISPLTFLVLAAALAALFLTMHLALPTLVAALMPLPIALRLLVAALVTLIVSVGTGMPSALALSVVREKHGDMAAWMWGISCAANALGAMSFALIAQVTGIAATLAIVAAMYLLANLGFAALVRRPAVAE